MGRQVNQKEIWVWKLRWLVGLDDIGASHDCSVHLRSPNCMKPSFSVHDLSGLQWFAPRSSRTRCFTPFSAPHGSGSPLIAAGRDQRLLELRRAHRAARSLGHLGLGLGGYPKRLGAGSGSRKWTGIRWVMIGWGA